MWSDCPAFVGRSGAVFYSGKNAFQGEKHLYILGLNPGGSDIDNKRTIESHINFVLSNPNPNWSEYKDESWGLYRPKGTHGLQPRILHLFNNIGVSPYDIPSSNLCFVRSRTENLISKDLPYYMEQCWKFHEKVISELGIRVVLCFGKTTGRFVCYKLAAHEFIESISEKNRRAWKSSAYKNQRGQVIIIATHPSRADWTNPLSDPSELVIKMLKGN